MEQERKMLTYTS